MSIYPKNYFNMFNMKISGIDLSGTISTATVPYVYQPVYSPTGAPAPAKLADVGVAIINTPRYCEFFKNLPTWVFDYQQLHQKIEKMNEKFIVQNEGCNANFINSLARSPTYEFDNFNVLYDSSGGGFFGATGSYAVRSKDAVTTIYDINETSASFVNFNFPLNEGVQLINLANNPELINFI